MNLHKKQHAVFSVWEHKVGDRKPKSRRGRRLCCLCMDSASLRLHWTVICVLERVPAGCDVVGIRVSTCWFETVALRWWTRVCPLQERLEHLLGVDKFRLLWV